ncbi:NAD(P)/FAD-dependent oxidoreductase [Paraferrimonas haliotis]|uniref:FAD-dependent oxidoreductase n=1 Tax=Paraferrimonas haliotis TaxID=2013866 RepID=A0AA37WVW3_9GAMM|nr:FAD-binding oxidoreductase [Paraferrimonas haliotis]GLS82592.1 FAD-dependent oxidoreductase [Paraferrimonas haliotis]
MYDPLLDSHPGEGERYPNSYWASTIADSNQAQQVPTLDRDLDTDVVIIGGGYTGLSCAIHLARNYGIKATLLEANQIGWGCSGRNAGFVLHSSGRRSIASMANQWGEEVAATIYQEMRQGVALVEEFIAQGIDCDVQSKGYIKIAHSTRQFKQLQQLANVQQSHSGTPIDVLTREQLHRDYMADHNAYGAIRYQDGFGLNPLKLALGYKELAMNLGVKLYQSTPVLSWLDKHGGKQRLLTPKGIVTAKKVVIATNGYTPKNFSPVITSRTLPVLSQIIVTNPLNPEQLQQANWLTDNVVMDTRALKYYYRKLPDNRVLFGGRGAISGKQASNPYYALRLLKVLKSSFPNIGELTIDYAWSGWICMTLDDIPHIGHDSNQSIHYGMGYCGSGLAFSAQVGKRLADQVSGGTIPNIPLYQSELPRFPLAPLRRVGQWCYFQYGKYVDRFN